MSGRFLFVCGGLLLFASVAFGQADYQRTKDGKTLVWNNDPKPGDEATWSGSRDREGYASGFGTLTWYTGQKQTVRRLGIPVTKSNLYARYFGNMARGKFNGPVNMHSLGKTDHAVFADGVRTTRWAAGPAPSRAGAQQLAEPAKEKAKIAKAESPPPSGSGAASAQHPTLNSQRPTTDTPAEGPSTARTVAKSDNAQLSTSNSQRLTQDNAQPASAADKLRRGEHSTNASPARTNAQPSSTADEPKAEVDDSLRSLVAPPSALRTNSVADASPGANARLTKEEVVDLADAEARSRGYDLTEYQRLDPQYNPADEIWSLGYDQRLVDGTAETGRHFSVTVDDKTKGTVFVSGK